MNLVHIISECIIALVGLILGFISVVLSYRSFREAKQAREDIAKFGFRQKQELAVAELVKYLNMQDLGFYKKFEELFKGNIWEVAETNRLNDFNDYEIARFKGNFSLLDVNDFVYNVYLPKEIAVVLKHFQMRLGGKEPVYGDKVIKIRTSFHLVTENDHLAEEATFDYYYLDEEINTVSKFINMAIMLKKAVEHWYQKNEILDTCNILPINNTGNGSSVIGMVREDEV